MIKTRLTVIGRRTRNHGRGLPLVVHFLFDVMMMALVVLPTSITAKESGGSARTVGESARIVGGRPVADGQYPFLAQYTGFSFCGATYIHEDILIGVAHCGVPSTCAVIMNSIELGVGSLTQVESFVFHQGIPGFIIMKLDASTIPPGATPVEYNTNPEIPTNGEALTIIGFGATDEVEDALSDVLLEATVDFVPFDECSIAFDGTDIEIFEEFDLCALREGQDTCYGDSGGPLLTNTNPPVVVGLTDFGIGCDAGFPGGYSRIDTSSEWINKAICCLSEFSSCDGVDCSEESLGIVYSCVPPPNDDCVDAIEITTTDEILLGSTVTASPDFLALVDDCDSPASGGNLYGVWYKVMGDGSRFRVSTCNENTDVFYDTFLSVYMSGPDGSCNSLDCVTLNDDAEESCSLSLVYSTVEWESESNVMYYILVHGYTNTVSGDFGLVFEKVMDRPDGEDATTHALMILQSIVDVIMNMLGILPDILNALMIVFNNQ